MSTTRVGPWCPAEARTRSRSTWRGCTRRACGRPCSTTSEGLAALRRACRRLARAQRGTPGARPDLADLPDQAAHQVCLVALERGDDMLAGAPPAPHLSCCMVAHRPAACSRATSTSILSLPPLDTTALPLWWTSSISLVA